MSLLQPLSLSGTPSIHKPTDLQGSSSTSLLRKAKSHSALFSPLFRLVRDPVGSLENAVESLWNPPSEELSKDVHKQNQRQILLYRMKDVSGFFPPNSDSILAHTQLPGDRFGNVENLRRRTR
jgi:hypothetical protein